MALPVPHRWRRAPLFSAAVRPVARLVVVALAAVVALVGVATPAYADPDGDGDVSSLAQKLEQVAFGYYDARAKLEASQIRQVELTKRLRDAEITLVRLDAEVSLVAAARYKGSQFSLLNGLLVQKTSPNQLLQGAAVAEYLIWRDDERLHRFAVAKDEAATTKTQLEEELKIQQAQLVELDKQKRAAEAALAAVGGMVSAGYTGVVTDAQAAPRTSGGGWPRESCSINDPTTSGCLTPRMFHTLNEARLAGFTHFVSCYRPSGPYEHPKGRACDFAAEKSGFAGAATGAARTYGNNLASWAVHNADALGIMYVIWYRQVWVPGVGWHYYSGARGDPSSNHTNHVHISML
ncbi:MAG: coiled-coil domain-containing protein [Micromonosporaceae bacterium]